MKQHQTQRGMATVTALLVVLVVLAAGGAVLYIYTPSEQQAQEVSEDEQRSSEEGTNEDIAPTTEEDEDIIPVEEQRRDEEEDTTVEQQRTQDIDPVPDDTTTNTHDDDEVVTVSTPTTLELVAGESVRLDGSMTLTLARAVLYERPSGGQADFQLSDAGGCGEDASSECIGPPGFQQEFSISETATEAVEVGGYSFTLIQLGTNMATVRVE